MSDNGNLLIEGPDTDQDSDPIEKVDSEEEFSRVIATPRVDRGDPTDRAGNSSTPKNRRNTPWELYNVVPSPLDKQTETQKSFKPDTQQTQQVAPLTGSQLKQLMGGILDSDAINSSSSDPETELIVDSSAQEDHADSSNPPSSSNKMELINPDLYKEDFTRDEADTTPHALSLEIIEETPLKSLDGGSRDAYLLVYWEADGSWWPCKSSKADWERRKRNATVTFREGEVGKVDLSKQAEPFIIHIDDHVRVANVKGLFRIDKVYTSEQNCSLKTSNGFNTVDLVYLKKFRYNVPVGDIYLLPKDRTNNMNKSIEELGESISNSRKAHLEKVDIPLTPNKKYKRVNIDQSSPMRSNTELSPIERSPVRKTPLRSTGKPTYVRSPRRNKQYLSGSFNGARSSIFRNCIFSISSIAEKSLINGGSAEGWKSELTALIEYHDGRVLKRGLADVVKFTDKSDIDGWMPQLKSDFGSATFIAVLTDHPKRTMKYLEMRALGWPCLHYKYIEDCINQRHLIDWLPYQLPAGEIVLPGRSMMVNSDVSEFHSRWSSSMSLNDQLLRRRVVMKSTVPICFQRSVRDEPEVLLLSVLCAANCGIWVYFNEENVPDGSVLLDMTLEDSPEYIQSNPETLYQIKNYAALNSTLRKCKEWLIQCIINGSPV